MAKKQDFCKNGHPRVPENIGKGRNCLLCMREKSKERNRGKTPEGPREKYHIGMNLRTYESIGEELGISRTRVQQIERSAIDKIRKQFPEMVEFMDLIGRIDQDLYCSGAQ